MNRTGPHGVRPGGSERPSVRGRIVAIVALWIGAGFVLWPVLWPDARTRLFRQATAAFAKNRYEQAEQRARAVLDRWPEDAAALVMGKSVTEAVRWASATAAIKATRPGAQDGIPDRWTIEAFLAGGESIGY